MKKVLVRKDAYFDSVFLMLLAKDLKGAEGVADATAALGTPVNRELLAAAGYPADDLEGAGPNDLLIAVDCATAEAAEAAVRAAESFLSRKAAPAADGGKRAAPRTLEAAVAALPGANVALISLPGAYAAREARSALERGLHVMLFSDNVPLEDEIALKELARSKGLLLMGPDCGTAIVNGKPLCFANVVRRGPVGIAAASGTGLQEVSCLLDRLGSGVSQAIGTGGRDLKNERVGGSTMLAAIEALAADPYTEVIVVVSKPPAPSVAARVVAALEASGKPSVVHFVGLDGERAGNGFAEEREDPEAPRLHRAGDLEEAARMAAALASGVRYERRDFDLDDGAIRALVEREADRAAPGQKWLRGYFTGGTLADEAWIAVHRLTGAAYSNNQTDPAFVPPDPRVSIGHTIVDLGDDAFTVGRPHPMIDPSVRTERIDAERDDPSIAVMLVDVVLGYGSCADPAGAVAHSLAAAKKAAARRGGYLSAVASVTGTPGDYQGYAAQAAKLEEAGVLVMPSNRQACLLAARIAERLGRPRGGRR